MSAAQPAALWEADLTAAAAASPPPPSTSLPPWAPSRTVRPGRAGARVGPGRVADARCFADEVIRKRLLIDGDGAGDDRRINLLVKSFLKWGHGASHEEGCAPTTAVPGRAGPGTLGGRGAVRPPPWGALRSPLAGP